MDLKDYETLKFELAAHLRALETLAGTQRESLQAEIRTLFARLAEDRFNLVVVGRFNRGKTSLMNALLGSDRLPTGILPLTSVITTVVYGTTERVLVKFRETRLDSEIALDALAGYITQEHNPGNVRRVETAEVQLPEEILRRGFHMIDTPGLGSHIAENTRTTERFLPEADAFVLVTSYESPVSEEELAVLHTASTSFRRVFVVINKQDTVSDVDRVTVQQYVRERLRSIFGEECPAVFSVSARDGLEAKRKGDSAGLAQSGITALELALTSFMLEEKRAVFLSGMCERMIDLAARLPDVGSQSQFMQAMQSVHDEIGRHRGQQALPVRRPVPGSLSNVHPQTCEICRHIQSATFDTLASYQHELASSADVQKQHALRGGLCRTHTRQYASLAPPHDICVGNAALIEWMSSELATLARSIDQLDEREPPPLCLAVIKEGCPLCLSAAHAEMQAISTLVCEMARLDDVSSERLSMICMPHLARALPALREGGAARALLTRQAAMLDRLAEDMRRYATKYDALRRYLASEEERDAAEMAVAALAGLPNGHVSGG
ncbi:MULTISPECIES: dynamin family protein [Burkholderia cepacia complex]|uniref:Dynamin family protein n=1 Tax=Burkholderia vietnamiensis TaxID=60552 RepID=A0AAW7TCV7_BURVI|nr:MULTISPECIES: dynamin family protein [Burkholderia cepacia complex]MDN7799434.1 dynamin family protein [Burkholderia vietnamiensis]